MSIQFLAALGFWVHRYKKCTVYSRVCYYCIESWGLMSLDGFGLSWESPSDQVWERSLVILSPSQPSSASFPPGLVSFPTAWLTAVTEYGYVQTGTGRLCLVMADTLMTFSTGEETQMAASSFFLLSHAQRSRIRLIIITVAFRAWRDFPSQMFFLLLEGTSEVFFNVNLLET